VQSGLWEGSIAGITKGRFGYRSLNVLVFDQR
jgi:hypothetical protein